MIDTLFAGSVLAFLFVVPWENTIMLDGVGTLSRLLGIIALAMGILAVVNRGFLIVDPPLLIILAYICYLIVIGMFSLYPLATSIRTNTLIQLGLMCLVLYQAMHNEKMISAGVAAYLLGCFVAVALVFAELQHGTGPRRSAAGFNPNDNALIMATGIPIAVWLREAVRTRPVSLLLLGYPALASAAIITTGSRSGSLAVAIAMIGALIVWVKTRFYLLMVLVIATAFAPLVAGGPGTGMARISEFWASLQSGELSGIDSRQVIWRVGFTEFAKNPLFGSGPGSFSATAGDDFFVQSKSAHNAYISELVEGGIVGLGAFLVVNIVVASAAIRLPFFSRFCWGSMLLILLVALMTHNFGQRKQTWILCTLILTLSRVVHSRPEDRLLVEPTRS